MFSLLDLMRAAQGGAAMNNMARQFGISTEQTQRALEALMPAFSLGFQRSAKDPTGFANLLGMMGSGQYARFFDQPGLAFTPRAWSEGNAVLAQLFGNDVSRQVAEQTAAWAGIAPEIMKQMMPVVATMLMGGLFRTAASEGLADLFEQFARILRGEEPGSRPAVRKRTEEPATLPDPFTAWADTLDALWGNAPRQKEPEPKPEPAPSGELPNPFAPWAAMMSIMLGNGQTTPPAGPAPPEPAPPEPPSPQAPFEFFNQMFEIGRDVQQQHLATLQNIFDTWGGVFKQR